MLAIMCFISRSFIWLFLLPFFFDLSFLMDSLPFLSVWLWVSFSEFHLGASSSEIVLSMRTHVIPG